MATTLTAAVTAMLMVTMMGLDGAGSSELLSSSCPPTDGGGDGPHVEELIYYSDVVVLGKVMRTNPELGKPDMYRVHMMVYCVFKGQQGAVPRMIDVWEAGNVTEACPERRMEVGMMYVAYLYKHSPTIYTPAFPHQPDTYRDELYVVCDLNISRPTDDLPAEEAEVTCEDEKPEYEFEDDYDDDEENCVRYEPRRGDSAHRMKKPRNLSGKTEKVAEGDGDGGEPSDGSAGGSVSASLLLLSSALAVARAARTARALLL